MAAGTMGRRGVVWRTPDITADGLKLFACAAMLIRTVGVAVIENGMINLSRYTQESLSAALAEDSHLMLLAGIGSVMQLIGGLAVPVFAFLLVEGFRHTAAFGSYLLRLLLFAVLSEAPYDLAFHRSWIYWKGQNALVAMVVCLLMLYCLRVVRKRAGSARVLLQGMIVGAAVIWVSLLRAEFGLCLVLLTAIFYLLETKHLLQVLLGAAVSLLYVTGPLAFYAIWCYNGKRTDRLPKYAYYVFYPLQLLAAGLIASYLLRGAG